MKISTRAMQSEGYLKNMELCADYACFLAAQRGRGTPNLADVQEAITRMMPSTAPPVTAEKAVPRKPAAKPLPPASGDAATPPQRCRNDAAASLQAATETEFSRSRASPIGNARAPVLTG